MSLRKWRLINKEADLVLKVKHRITWFKKEAFKAKFMKISMFILF